MTVPPFTEANIRKDEGKGRGRERGRERKAPPPAVNSSLTHSLFPHAVVFGIGTSWYNTALVP
jgi:hypothetical protein